MKDKICSILDLNYFPINVKPDQIMFHILRQYSISKVSHVTNPKTTHIKRGDITCWTRFSNEATILIKTNNDNKKYARIPRN